MTTESDENNIDLSIQGRAVKLRAGKASRGLVGELEVEADKSLSLRAVLLGSLAQGRSYISNLLLGGDVRSALRVMEQLGVGVRVDDTNDTPEVIIEGRGLYGYREPTDILDMGNSGTLTRLLMGILCCLDSTFFLTGDSSLRRRPMGRVIGPLRQTGAQIHARSNGLLPLMISGTGSSSLGIAPICHTVEVPSAQVKSALLLASLHSGKTSVIKEKTPTRNHTENLLLHLGVNIACSKEGGAERIDIQCTESLPPLDIRIVGDFSSAAFVIAAGLICKNSHIVIRNVGINKTRIGLLGVIRRMGGNVQIHNRRSDYYEDYADIVVRHSELQAVEIAEEETSFMIDEFPIVSVLASYGRGTSHFCGLGELRYKESDRIKCMEEGLRINGVEVESNDDSLTIVGGDGEVLGGGEVAVHSDHRIAMSFLILGLNSKHKVVIDDGRMIATSFPSFLSVIKRLGGCIEVAKS